MSPSYCINELWYKPFMWRRADVWLWRVLVSHFRYKPFMWCRPDTRLWHYYSAFFLSRSLSDTRLAPVLLFRIFRSRSLSDTRLAPVLLFCSFRSRRHSDPRLAPSIYYLYVWSHWLTCSCASCLHLLYLMSELSCEYFHSTHLACWFGQMLTKAISWMKSLIARPMPRGVPVSPARSRILVTCIVYASAARNKSSRASLRRSKSC